MALPGFQPINPFGNYLAGQQAAVQQTADQQQNALRTMQVARSQNLNALAADPNATPEQYIRAGDAQTGNALLQNQQRDMDNKRDAQQQVGTLSKRIVENYGDDPVKATAVTQQLVNNPSYHPVLQMAGLDPAKLDFSDPNGVLNSLRALATLAPPDKPLEVAAGGSVYMPDGKGGYKSVASAPEKPTDDQRNYQEAVKGGFKGSFFDYQKGLKDAAGDNELKAVTGPDGQPRFVRAKDAVGMTPSNPSVAAATDSIDAYKNDPDLRRTAAIAVMSDPARMRDYATYGAGGQGIRTVINQEIAQVKKETGMSDADFVRARVTAKADSANLNKLVAQNTQIDQAEGLLRANGDRALQLINMVDQTGVPLIEGWRRSAKAKMGGVDEAELRSVLQTFQTEAARLLTAGPTMNGVISDSARHELSAMVPDNMSADQAKRVINRVFTEASIRQQLNQGQINRMSSGAVVGATPTPDTQPQPPAGGQSTAGVRSATGPNGQKLYLRNGQWVPQ